MIRVAVADDSAFTCRLLASYLDTGGECRVVGMTHDAASTIDLVDRLHPDVLTLDLEMPGGGLGLLRRAAAGTSVVVISGVTHRAAAMTLRALENGAVDFILKYTPGAPASPASLRREIVAKVTAAASVRSTAPVRPGPLPPHDDGDQQVMRRARHADRAVIVIGASTGGPAALRDLVRQLPHDFDTPCVIVQHLPSSFVAPFAEQLARYAKVPVREARPAEPLAPGHLLVSPGGQHLVVRAGGRLEFRAPTEDDVYRPSIDVTMTSAAESFGSAVTGVMLSGMGSDGAEGLRCIRAAGGSAFVQAPDSCVIASMPARALERAGADFVGSPERIGALLARAQS